MPHAGEADTAGRGILRETRVRATEEGPRRTGNPGGRRRTTAHPRRCPGTVPEVCRRADPRPVPGRRAGQVLALPGGVAGLRRDRSGGGRGQRLPQRRPEDLQLISQPVEPIHVWGNELYGLAIIARSYLSPRPVTHAARQRATGRHFPRHRSLAPEGASNRECRQRRAWTERTGNPMRFSELRVLVASIFSEPDTPQCACWRKRGRG